MRLSVFVHRALHEIALGLRLAKTERHGQAAPIQYCPSAGLVPEKIEIEFDIEVIAGGCAPSDDGKLDPEVQVVSIYKPANLSHALLETSLDTNAHATHRISFKIPLYVTAPSQADLPTAGADQNLANQDVDPAFVGSGL